jgi:hypothetical protein
MLCPFCNLWCHPHPYGMHANNMPWDVIFPPLGFTFCNNFARVFQHHHFVFFFFVLLQCLWSSNYSSTTCHWISWWTNFFTLILCTLLNHKVDKWVSILLLSSFNVGCHGTTPRFRVCVFLEVFVNTLLWSWPTMYLVTFVKALLLGFQLDQKYLVEI